MIRFDDAGIVYADLGSTNGTVVGGARLGKNVPTHLTDKSGILLGAHRACRLDPVEGDRPDGYRPQEDLGLGAWRGGRARRGGETVRSPGVRAEQVLRRLGGDATAANPGKQADAGAAPAGEPGERNRPLAPAPDSRGVQRGVRRTAEGIRTVRRRGRVRTINGRSVLHRARTGEAVLDHLLQTEVEVATVRRDLNAVFADFGFTTSP